MSAFDSTGAGAAFGRNGRTYARALESSLRIIAAAEHGKELVVFANQARELAHHVRAGGLELLPVVMALDEAGSTYVSPKHGHPSVQVALAQAFSNSVTLPEHHRTEAPPTAGKGRFLLTRFADLKVSTAPAQLIRGLIPRVGLTVVWGPPKSGKSFVVFDAMMHVATGEDYRSREVIHGPIVTAPLKVPTVLKNAPRPSASATIFLRVATLHSSLSRQGWISLVIIQN
jgi:AAA domain